MSRERAEHVAQGTWRSGSLHVWGWNGESTASAAWLYGGFGHNRWSGAENGWHDTPASYGELSRIELELPSGRRKSVPSVRLDPYGAAVWLSDTPGGDELSASLAWFARLSASPSPTSRAAGSRRRSSRKGRSSSPGGFRSSTMRSSGRSPRSTTRHRRSAATAPARLRPTCSPPWSTVWPAHSSTASAGSLISAGSDRPTCRCCARCSPSLARTDAVVRGGTTEFQRELDRARAAAPPRRAPRRSARVRAASAADDPGGRGRSVGGHARGLRRARPRSVVHRRRRLERVWRRPRPGSRRAPPPTDGAAHQRPRQHRGPAHPRPGRSGRRARAVRGRARPRRRRRLPRHRPRTSWRASASR